MKMIIQIFFSGMILIQAASTYAIEVKIAVPSESEERDQYRIGLLNLILEKSGANFTITKSSKKRTQSRIIHELKTGSDKINLHWMGTSKELENDLLPIRFPIYRGLLGYRLFLIHKNDQSKFDNVKTLSDLQKFTGAQGLGWVDIEILEYSGLKQYVTLYENIFKMLNAGGRIDYFSRGVGEAFVELEAKKEKFTHLDVEKNILLVYPFAMFFFTSPANTGLAEKLENGFRKSYEDGSLNTYFYNHPEIKKLCEQANIRNRIRIDIPNPILTQETADIPDKYWHGR